METEVFSRKKSINCSGKLLSFQKPLVMGILNVSPDSFYDGGKYNNPENAKTRIEKMQAEGADIIDIGAYSSRPGAKDLSVTEELERLLPFLEICLKKSDSIVFSIDTFRAEIAKIAVKDYGISIINDISGGSMDCKMFDTVAELNVPYIMMHIKGVPQNMQQNPEYADVMEEIIRYFSEKLESLRKRGVHDIILDPGFGFGKSIEHNYEILGRLQNFKIFELPILVGFSRKSMIYKFLECTPDEALNGTSILNTIALTKGADILRVHDVAEARQAVELFVKTNNFQNK